MHFSNLQLHNDISLENIAEFVAIITFHFSEEKDSEFTLTTCVHHFLSDHFTSTLADQFLVDYQNAPEENSLFKMTMDHFRVLILLYEQTMHKADKLVITHVPGKYTADAFFPDISDDFKVMATERLSDTEAYVAYYERA